MGFLLTHLIKSFLNQISNSFKESNKEADKEIVESYLMLWPSSSPFLSSISPILWLLLLWLLLLKSLRYTRMDLSVLSCIWISFFIFSGIRRLTYLSTSGSWYWLVTRLYRMKCCFVKGYLKLLVDKLNRLNNIFYKTNRVKNIHPQLLNQNKCYMKYQTQSKNICTECIKSSIS